jgi:tripartite-type tricarboxylate transporter receptor subunit TctC
VTLLRRQFIGLASAAAGAAILPRSAWPQTQTYPSRLIKIVVPFPAGGPTDLMGRMAAQHLSSSLGQNVIVENVVGAGGTIGTQAVARANPDGYTLLLGGTNSNAISAALYKKLSYDPVRDFAPIASLAIESEALLVHPLVPVKTIQEFRDYLKANPGKITCGAVPGVMPYVMVAFFMVRSGTSMVLVPYRGAAPMITDLLSGHIQMTVLAKASALPHVQTAKLRALAVTSEARWAELPDVPTMREVGFADFPDYQWFGLLAPAGTPATVIDKLNASINSGLRSTELGATLAKLGLEAKMQTPQELQQLLLAEARQWDAIVTSTGIKID